jgi:hypothetical protein
MPLPQSQHYHLLGCLSLQQVHPSYQQVAALKLLLTVMLDTMAAVVGLVQVVGTPIRHTPYTLTPLPPQPVITIIIIVKSTSTKGQRATTRLTCTPSV